MGSGPTQLDGPWGLVIDPDGNYVMVDKSYRTQKCGPTGQTCETGAGGAEEDGPARLNRPPVQAYYILLLYIYAL